MDKAEIAKFALASTEKQIILDLIPKYVLQNLKETGAITGNQWAQCSDQLDLETQVKQLVEFIRSNGSDALECFIESCKYYGFPWLAKAIRDAKERFGGFVDTMHCMVRRGGIPQLPSNMCPRPTLLRKLKDEIKWMYDGVNRYGLTRWVITWGMAGEGKTMLMASALRDPVLFRDLDIKHVYWIKVGCGLDEEAIRVKIHTLCEKIDPVYVSSPSANLDVAVDRLSSLFSTDEYKDSLLVLDDVWDKNVINAFNFGCRVLISTRDKGIMAEYLKECHFVAMQDDVVTIDDSFNFFAQSLQLEVNHLPREIISEIYNKIKGSMIMLAHINSIVVPRKKDVNSGFLRIQNALNQIRTSTISVVSEIFPEVFRLSYDSLDDSLKEYYIDLAIFKRNVSISSNVLAILWGLDASEAEYIMQQLIDKSIATLDQQDETLTSYNIHDLCFDYLKSTCSDTFPDRHRKLINNYRNKYNNNDNKFNKFPDDGYIFKYLCYHLLEAGMSDVIPSVLLDLEMMSIFLSAGSPADMMGDLTRYKKYLCHNEYFEKRFMDFQKFIQQELFYLSTDTIDPIQLALTQPEESEVYKDAVAIASRSADKTYFLWKNRHNINSSSTISTKHHQGKVNCVIFSSDGRFVISAGEDKIVKIWDSNSGRETVRLVGHTEMVNSICSYFDSDVSQEVIVSCSNDSTVKIWRASLLDMFKKNRRESVEEEIIICETFTGHRSSVICCSVDSKGQIIASIDDLGILKLWNPENKLEIQKSCTESENLEKCCSCSLSSDGSMLVVSTRRSLKLWRLSTDLLLWSIASNDYECFNFCCFSPDDVEVMAIVVSYKKKVSIVNGSSVVFYSVKSEKKTFKSLTSNSELIVCTMSKDKSFMAATDKSKFIVVWSQRSNQLVTHHTHYIGNILSVAFDRSSRAEDGDQYRLVSSNTLGGAVIWKSSEEGKRLWTQKRDLCLVRFDENNSPSLIDNSLYTIQVWDIMNNNVGGQFNVCGAKKEKISCCFFSEERDKVMYGTARGHLMLLDITVPYAASLPLYYDPSQKNVTQCLISSNGDAYIGAYINGRVVIVNKSGTECSIPCHKSLTHVKLFNNDKCMLTYSKDWPGLLKVWCVSDGELKFVCDGHKKNISCCDVDEERHLIVSVSNYSSLIVLWDSDSGAKLMELPLLSNNTIICCCFISGSNWLATGDSTGFVFLWQFDLKQIDGARELPTECLKTGTKESSIKPMQLVVILKANMKKGAPVNELVYCQERFELVTCSDVIKWWNLAQYLDNYVASTFTDHNQNKSEQTFFVKGTVVKRIFCSPHFETFVAVDNTGIIYYLSRLSCQSRPTSENQHLELVPLKSNM